MDVPTGSQQRRRTVLVVAVSCAIIACSLIYTVVSTRQITDDVVSSVSEVYLDELSKQVVFHFNVGMENKFSQLAAMASGLVYAKPQDRTDVQGYLELQRVNDDFAFLALRTDDGALVTDKGVVPQVAVNADRRSAPIYLEGQDRCVMLYKNMVILMARMPPVRFGDETVTTIVCGYDAMSLSERLNLTLFDGFSRTIVLDQAGDCVIGDPGSGLESGDDLIALVSEKATYGLGYNEKKLREGIERGETVNVPITYDEKPENLYFMPLPRTGWYLCTVMPSGVIGGDIGGLSATVARNGLIVGGIVLATILIFFIMYYRLAKRNTRLLAGEKHRAERALEKAQQASIAKTEFLSRMSHEIRTPMNGIMGMTAIALQNIGDDDKVHACLDKVTLSSEHLLSLINDVLDMSKIESGKIEIKSDVFELPTFINSLTAVFRTQASERGIAYATEVGGEVPPRLIGDPLRLNQVIYNLMNNAFKFTPAGGSVVLRVEGLDGKSVDHDAADDAPQGSALLDGAAGERWLRFSVTDTGCGIGPEHLDKIFASFEQGDAAVGRSYGGTGLGLAITKRFVELMGGRIRVSSIVGHGSTFAVDVPFAQPVGEALSSAEPAPPEDDRAACDERDVPSSYDFSGARILVVEDNALNQEIAVELMEMAGACVDATDTGRKAVEMFTASEPGFYDLVLMDVQMPDMDGYEAARTIRGLNRSDAASIVILAMTANAFVDDERRSLASGMNGHLSKPLDIRRVYATINGFLEKRHTTR